MKDWSMRAEQEHKSTWKQKIRDNEGHSGVERRESEQKQGVGNYKGMEGLGGEGAQVQW